MFVRYANAEVINTIIKKEEIVRKAKSIPLIADLDFDKYVIFRCRIMTGDAPNGNGDYFPWKEIVSSYKTMIGKPLDRNHVMTNPMDVKGHVFIIEPVESAGDNYLEGYAGVDRELDANMADMVAKGALKNVSMSCLVSSAQCSICNNLATTPKQICKHMRGFKEGGLKGSKTIVSSLNPYGIHYEIQRGITFTGLAVVDIPADPSADIWEVYSALGLTKESIITSIETLTKYFEYINRR